MPRAHLIRGETVPSCCGGSEVLDQKIGSAAQVEEAMPPIGVVQVEHDAALVRVAIQEWERPVGGRRVTGERRAQAAGVAPRRLDLQHGGAPVSPPPARERRPAGGPPPHANGGQRPPACHGHRTRAPGYFQPATWYPRSARHWFT